MEGKREDVSMGLKEWATKHMEYVPRVSSDSAERNGNKDFQSKLRPGRLGIYWQHLICHARSRSQVQHIRDNLKLQEYHDTKNKKNGKCLLSSTTTCETLSFDNTLRSNTTYYSQKDFNNLTLGTNASALSERDLLVKEYEETKRLLKKSNSHRQRAKADIERRVSECEELKHQLQAYEANIDENYEKLKFLSLLIQRSKESVNVMKKDTQSLEGILQRRFEGTNGKQSYGFGEEELVDHIKNMLRQICEKSKYLLHQITHWNSSTQINVNNKILTEIRQLVEALLFPNLNNHSVKDYCTVSIMVHEAFLLEVRSITRQVDNELCLKSSETTKAPPDQVENILNGWREHHVMLVSESKAMANELKLIESETEQKGKLAKNAISEIVDSDSGYNNESRRAIKQMLQNYFMGCEKRARLKRFLSELSEYVTKPRIDPISSTKLKTLANVSKGHSTEIENKKKQIDTLLQRNGNLNTKLTWLANKMCNLLDTYITDSIHQILPIIRPNDTMDNHMNGARDRILRRFNNFTVFPVQLNLSLNINGQVCGREIRDISRSSGDLTLFKPSLNGSLAIQDFIKIKILMKKMEEASLLGTGSSFGENKKTDAEEKVKNAKDHTQLINKLDEIIRLIEKSNKHFGFRI